MIIHSSFRDPSGFVFIENGKLYRQINQIYKDDYDQLMNSGLYDSLADSGLLIPHKEAKLTGREREAYKIIQPEPLDFISYPYEWSFSQLKDAALTTLEVQKKALEYEMSLKDSSAYNIQFLHGKPLLVDTLSFERYKEGLPWVAYKQFCQHFLAPLALMSKTDIRLGHLMKTFLDGIALDLASSLLPKTTYLNYNLLIHIHLHAKSQKHFSNRGVNQKKIGKAMSKSSLQGLIDSLESSVKKLKWKPKATVWSDYYEGHISYNLEHKKELVEEFLLKAKPKNVWDMGANIGTFSRISSDNGIPTLAFDFDPACVEANYSKVKGNNEKNVLPLLMDLTNPSPSIGWENRERMSLMERGPVDTIMSLALIHHLAIANNLPLPRLASFYAGICKRLIIEFIPKSDPKVQLLLSSREDIFPEYTSENFENAFAKHFVIKEKKNIEKSDRTLYLMIKK